MTRDLITTLTPDEIRVMVLESVWFSLREAGLIKRRLTKTDIREFLESSKTESVEEAILPDYNTKY